jgi:hypothetical protein
MARYQYVKIPRHNHPMTLSYEVLTKPSDSSLLIAVGVSFCHNKDSFSKKFGRKVADGRRLKSPYYVGFSDLDPSSSFGNRIVDSLNRWVESSWKEIIRDMSC